MTEQERIESIKKNGGCHLKNFKPENITYDMCVTAVSEDGNAIVFVPEQFRTPEIYALSCRFHGFNLRLVPPELRTKEMCETAVMSEVAALQYVPEEYRTEELYRKAALKHPYALKLIPEEIITPEFCAKIIDKNGRGAISSLPDSCKNTAFYLKLIEEKPEIIWCIPKKNRTKAVCKKALERLGYKSLADAVRDKTEFLGLVPYSMYDHDASLAFVESTYLKTGLNAKPGSGMRASVEGRDLVFLDYRYSAEKLLQWYDVCLAAVKVFYRILEFVPERLITQELCWCAVEADIDSFRNPMLQEVNCL